MPVPSACLNSVYKWGALCFGLAFIGSAIPFLLLHVSSKSHGRSCPSIKASSRDNLFKSRQWIYPLAFIVGLIIFVCGSRLTKVASQLVVSPFGLAPLCDLGWILGTYLLLTAIEGVAHYFLTAYAHHGLHGHGPSYSYSVESHGLTDSLIPQQDVPRVELEARSGSAFSGRSSHSLEEVECGHMTVCNFINDALHRQSTGSYDPPPIEGDDAPIDEDRDHKHRYEVNFSEGEVCQTASAMQLTRPLCDGGKNADLLQDMTEEHTHHSQFHSFMDYLSASIFYLAFSLHSIIEGTGLATSLLSNSRAAQTLGVGIVGHKGLAAVAVGGSISRLNTSMTASIFLMALFSLSTPLGMALGILFDPNKKVTSILNMMTTGSMLFVLLNELIPQLVANVQSLAARSKHPKFDVLACISGVATGLMCMWLAHD